MTDSRTTLNAAIPPMEGQISYIPASRAWILAVTKYNGNMPCYTIHVSHPSLLAAARVMERAIGRVELDLQHEMLMLPNMGDFEVFYFPPD